MKLTNILQVLMVVAVTLVLVGCAAPRFSPVATIPKDKALVYIYRNAALGGIAGNHHIFVNGQPVASLYSGSYYPYYATPGTNSFSSRMISPAGTMDAIINAISRGELCRLDVEAGHIYYIQFKIATTLGPKIVQVDADKGAKDIKKCRLANPL